MIKYRETVKIKKGTVSLFQCFCSKEASQIEYEETLW